MSAVMDLYHGGGSELDGEEVEVEVGAGVLDVFRDDDDDGCA